jgi:hypothetical protein
MTILKAFARPARNYVVSTANVKDFDPIQMPSQCISHPRASPRPSGGYRIFRTNKMRTSPPIGVSGPRPRSTALDQGFVLDDDANAFFTTAESFVQPQASEFDGFTSVAISEKSAGSRTILGCRSTDSRHFRLSANWPCAAVAQVLWGAEDQRPRSSAAA